MWVNISTNPETMRREVQDKMLQEENVKAMGDNLAQACHLVPIVYCEHILRAIQDNATVQGLIREWLRRIERKEMPLTVTLKIGNATIDVVLNEHEIRLLKTSFDIEDTELMYLASKLWYAFSVVTCY